MVSWRQSRDDRGGGVDPVILTAPVWTISWGWGQGQGQATSLDCRRPGPLPLRKNRYTFGKSNSRRFREAVYNKGGRRGTQGTQVLGQANPRRRLGTWVLAKGNKVGASGQGIMSDAGTRSGAHKRAVEAGGGRVRMTSRWTAFHAGRGGGEMVKQRGIWLETATEGGDRMEEGTEKRSRNSWDSWGWWG